MKITYVDIYGEKKNLENVTVKKTAKFITINWGKDVHLNRDIITKHKFINNNQFVLEKHSYYPDVIATIEG